MKSFRSPNAHVCVCCHIQIVAYIDDSHSSDDDSSTFHTYKRKRDTRSLAATPIFQQSEQQARFIQNVLYFLFYEINWRIIWIII